MAQKLMVGQIWDSVRTDFKIKIIGFRTDSDIDTEVVHRGPDCGHDNHLVVGYRWQKNVHDLHRHYTLES